MANRRYLLGWQTFLDGGISWSSDTIKAVLVSAGYVPNTTTDQFLSDVGGGNIVATSSAFASKTSTLGVADAGDLTYSAVTGVLVTQIVIYKDTGSSATSPLILLIDTATNLPVLPNGGDIIVAWDNGANKIFALKQALSDEARGLAGAGDRVREILDDLWGWIVGTPEIIQGAPVNT